MEHSKNTSKSKFQFSSVPWGLETKSHVSMNRLYVLFLKQGCSKFNLYLPSRMSYIKPSGGSEDYRLLLRITCAARSGLSRPRALSVETLTTSRSDLIIQLLKLYATLPSFGCVYFSLFRSAPASLSFQRRLRKAASMPWSSVELLWQGQTDIKIWHLLHNARHGPDSWFQHRCIRIPTHVSHLEEAIVKKPLFPVNRRHKLGHKGQHIQNTE
jgi:hypothetical protein